MFRPAQLFMLSCAAACTGTVAPIDGGVDSGRFIYDADSGTEPPKDCGIFPIKFTPNQPGNMHRNVEKKADDGGLRLLPVERCDDALLSAEGTTCGNGENPPTGGWHCSHFLPCAVYRTPQFRCRWVHNMEHGHLVLSYNCPGGCAATVSQLADVFEGAAFGRARGPNGVPRIVVTPDPLLDAGSAVAVGLTLWQYSLVLSNPDAGALERAVRCMLPHQDQFAPEGGFSCCRPVDGGTEC